MECQTDGGEERSAGVGDDLGGPGNDERRVECVAWLSSYAGMQGMGSIKAGLFHD